MKKLLLVIIFFVIAYGLYITFYKQQNNPLMNEKKPESKKIASKEEVKVIEMTAKNWEFNPAVIAVKQGEKVKLIIKSVDVDHGFALPDFDVKVNLKPGVEETVEFIATKKGEFTYFCSVFCGEGHREMKGKLIVE